MAQRRDQRRRVEPAQCAVLGPHGVYAADDAVIEPFVDFSALDLVDVPAVGREAHDIDGWDTAPERCEKAEERGLCCARRIHRIEHIAGNDQRVQHSGTAAPESLKLTTDTPQRVAGTWDLDARGSGDPTA